MIPMMPRASGLQHNDRADDRRGSTVTRALRRGASGYLLKSILRTEMLDGIRTVHAGRRKNRRNRSGFD
jgi:DNA-binding NarL/FixJ family response regulator